MYLRRLTCKYRPGILYKYSFICKWFVYFCRETARLANTDANVDVTHFGECVPHCNHSRGDPQPNSFSSPQNLFIGQYLLVPLRKLCQFRFLVIWGALEWSADKEQTRNGVIFVPVFLYLYFICIWAFEPVFLSAFVFESSDNFYAFICWLHFPAAVWTLDRYPELSDKENLQVIKGDIHRITASFQWQFVFPSEVSFWGLCEA